MSDFKLGAWISHTTSPTPPSYEVGGIAKRIKTVRLRRKTNLQKSEYSKTRTKRGSNALYVLECDNLYLCQMINIQCVILIIGGSEISKALKNYKNSEWSKDFVEACNRWKRLIMVNSMQANEAPQERMSVAWWQRPTPMSSLGEGRLWFRSSKFRTHKGNNREQWFLHQNGA